LAWVDDINHYRNSIAGLLRAEFMQEIYNWIEKLPQNAARQSNLPALVFPWQKNGHFYAVLQVGGSPVKDKK